MKESYYASSSDCLSLWSRVVARYMSIATMLEKKALHSHIQTLYTDRNRRSIH